MVPVDLQGRAGAWVSESLRHDCRIPVDEDALQDGRWLAGSLSGIAGPEQLLSEEQGIQKCLVGPEDPGGLESVMANEVHVLVVDDDRRLQWLWQVTSQEKTPPVPEDGGELGGKYGTTPDFRLNSGQILQRIHVKRAATESYPQVCLERRGQERISRDSEFNDVGQKSLATKVLGGGQGRGRTADLPIFRWLREHRCLRIAAGRYLACMDGVRFGLSCGRTSDGVRVVPRLGAWVRGWLPSRLRRCCGPVAVSVISALIRCRMR